MTAVPRTLRAHALLLGERLDFRALASSGIEASETTPTLFEDGASAVLFRWGAVCFLGTSAEAESRIRDRIAPFLQNPLPHPSDEAALLDIGTAEDGLGSGGRIALRDDAPQRLAVVADVLAKSALLSQQETTLGATLDRLDPIVSRLRQGGRLAAFSAPLRSAIGEALWARSRAAARVAVDDKPDVLWDNPELERLYLQLAQEFELQDRSAALERKLALVGTTVETVMGLMDSRRSLVLEVAVASLIAIEVGTTVYDLLAG